MRRDAAKREAELIIAEAHQEARSITRTAPGRARAAVRRGTPGRDAAPRRPRDRRGVEAEREQRAADCGRTAPSEHWPTREDTREFQAPSDDRPRCRRRRARTAAASPRSGPHEARQRRTPLQPPACPPPRRPRSTALGPAGDFAGGSLRRRERPSIDAFRTLLEDERARLPHAVEFLHGENPGSMEDELGEIGSGGVDNHLGDTASATFDRELDQGLEEGAQQTLAEIDAALARIDDGTYGICELCGKPIGEERLARDPVGAALHRRPAARRLTAHRSEAPTSGSARRRTAWRRSRSPSGRSRRGPVAVGRARRRRARGDRRRPGDEARRHEHACARRLGACRRPALDPPRAELRHRVRALLQRDRDRHRRHGRRGRLDGRVLRPLGRAAPGAAGSARAADRRQPLEPRRPDPAAPCHRLHRPRLLAGVQPRRQLHRDRRRDPARRARRRPTASRGRRGARSTSRATVKCAARRPPASGSTASSRPPRLPRRRRARGRGRRARRRRRARPKSFRLDGRGGGRAAPTAPGAARRRRPPVPRSSGRTSTCSSSTSPPGLVVHPGAGPRERDARRCARRQDRGRRSGAARRRAPARPRHVGPDGVARSEEAHGGCRQLVRERAFERTYLALVQRPAALAHRPDRGADRPRPRRSDRISLDTDTPREAMTNFEVERLWPGTRCCGCASRPGRMHQIRVHLAAVELPVAGDADLRRRRAAPRAPVPPRDGARVPASVQRRADRDRLGAAARPGCVPRRRC